MNDAAYLQSGEQHRKSCTLRREQVLEIAHGHGLRPGGRGTRLPFVFASVR
jgi:hypothetical protein